MPFSRFLIVFLFVFFGNGFAKISSEVDDEHEITDIQMPGVTTTQNETYLCTAYPLNVLETHYIVGFEPIADNHQVHHMLMFGCEEPGNNFEPVWDCGEMATSESKYAKSPTCASQPDILYAWGKGAPKLELPKDVGFRVGAETKSRYIVLQIHYMHKTEQDDFSGIKVVSTQIPQPRIASTLLVVTGGKVGPKTTQDFEAACVIDEQVVMHPFAFRVHTHKHGTKVTGWLVKEDAETRTDAWTLIGERDPQLPQIFEPVKNTSMVVLPGDIVAARCTIKNDENREIGMGPSGEDEMCNFYMMYWTETEPMQDNTCFSPGAPEYSWKQSSGLNHIPHH